MTVVSVAPPKIVRYTTCSATVEHMVDAAEVIHW